MNILTSLNLLYILYGINNTILATKQLNLKETIFYSIKLDSTTLSWLHGTTATKDSNNL